MRSTKTSDVCDVGFVPVFCFLAAGSPLDPDRANGTLKLSSSFSRSPDSSICKKINNQGHMKLSKTIHIFKILTTDYNGEDDGIPIVGVMAHSSHYIYFYVIGCMAKDHPDKGRKEGNVLFNDAFNTFYLRLYDIKHMVKDHSDSEKGNLLPPHGPLFPISSKGPFICIIPKTG